MDEAKSQGETRETMTTMQVAKRLKISPASVRRRVDSGELQGTWSLNGAVHLDVNGNQLRGHRRIFVDSVEAYERRAQEAEAATARQDS
jgi:hypothetical protein